MLRRKPWLLVSAVLLAIYIAYVLWAKFAAILGPPPMRLSETGEFLLFLASVVAFALQVIREDGAPDHSRQPGDDT